MKNVLLCVFYGLFSISAVPEEVDAPLIAPSFAGTRIDPFLKLFRRYYQIFGSRNNPDFFYCSQAMVIVIRKSGENFFIGCAMGDREQLEQMKGIAKEFWLDLDAEIARSFLDLWRKWGSTAKYSTGGNEGMLRLPSYFAIKTNNGLGYYEGVIYRENGAFSRAMADLAKEIFQAAQTKLIAGNRKASQLNFATVDETERQEIVRRTEEALKIRMVELGKDLNRSHKQSTK
jgi:hypothetical protein